MTRMRFTYQSQKFNVNYVASNLRLSIASSIVLVTSEGAQCILKLKTKGDINGDLFCESEKPG